MYMNFGEQIWYVLSEEIFETFIPKWSNVNEMDKNRNKNRRGLYALLGHMLVKRIPVTYKLSSTKIPEYLSHK